MEEAVVVRFLMVGADFSVNIQETPPAKKLIYSRLYNHEAHKLLLNNVSE
jgi:hypothetical protein